MLVLPSLKTFEAAEAALAEVTFLGAFVWDNALPPAVFDLADVEDESSVFDAFLATLELVTLGFAI